MSRFYSLNCLLVVISMSACVKPKETVENKLESTEFLSGEKYVYVTSDGLPLRNKAATGGEICAELPAGTKLKVNGINDKVWVQVTEFPTNLLNPECKEGTYYVNSDYIAEKLQIEKSIEGSGLNEVKFARACEDQQGKTKVTLAFVGDTLMHKPLQDQSLHNPKQFSIHWENVQKKLAEADFTYANFEGPSAPGINNSSYPSFNYPAFFPDNLKKGGIDIVSTANNHFIDKGVKGVDLTIKNFNDSNLPFFGTKLSTAGDDFYKITEINGKGGSIKVGWVACTFSNNFGGSSVDPHHQALYCYAENGGGGGSNPKLLSIVSKLASDKNLDAVIVTPHWGEEGVQNPGARQKALKSDLIDAGATLIIGAHPHVLQPWEKIEKNGKEIFVHYSLGNFTSNQPSAAQRASIILYVGMVKDENGKVYVDGVRYLPMYTAHANEGVNKQPYHTLIPIRDNQNLDSIGTASKNNIFKYFPVNYKLDLDEPVITNALQCGK